MIDHLIRFQDEYDLDALQITLPEDGEISTTAIDATAGELSITVLAVSIINNEAEFDPLTGELLTPAVFAAGKWIVVRAQAEISAWREYQQLVAITDNARAVVSAPFVVWKNSAFPWEAMQGRVSPTFAGSHYPFGPHMNESQLIV